MSILLSGCAPIFDCGQSMECSEYTDYLNFINGCGKFFSNPRKDYDDILKIILKDIRNVDLQKLDGLSDEYKEMLKNYQTKLDISDLRIEKLVNGLQYRIEKLKNYIK